MTAGNFSKVNIEGTTDEEQLVVRGHTTQTEPIQEWQSYTGSQTTPVAEMRSDGGLRLGGNFGSGTQVALLETNAQMTSSSALKQGIQARGEIDGGTMPMGDPYIWSAQELVLKGSGGVSGDPTALRSRIENQNTGGSGSADFRAAEFEVCNAADTSGTPVGQATGFRVVVSNAASAHLDKAVAAELEIDNQGTLTTAYGLLVNDMPSADDYAIKTGTGRVVHGGHVGIGVDAPEGRLHLGVGPTWGPWNWGANLIIDGNKNNVIGFLDSTSSNPWAIGAGGGSDQ